MIKKIKFFWHFFSTTTLLPISLLSISCGKTQSVANSDYSKNGNNDRDKMAISEEIKGFIKEKMSPDGKTNQSILVIKDLVDKTIDSTTQKSEEINKIESSLDQLSSKLNKDIEEDEIELKDNKIVEDALKQIIYDKCRSTSILLKNKLTDEFNEVATEKILDIDANQLFFNLKSFGIDKILHDIGYNENETDVKIADSQALKIYRFSTNLKVTVNTNGGKKTQLAINDLNLFIVSDKEQVIMLKQGITDYLEEKFTKNTIFIYLDGNALTENTNLEINEHFTEILKYRNYNLVGNEKNRMQTMSYLTDKYLPKLIYHASNQNTKTDQQENPIKIDSKNLVFDSKKDNFLKNGMEMSEDFKRSVNFTNFFGNQQKSRQISVDNIDEIKPDHFLKDKKIHNEQYYSLGAGILNVNEWSIRGFQLRRININFEILINCEILKIEIKNLQISLNNLLNIMSKSSVNKRYLSRKYVLDINLDNSVSASIVSQLENEKNAQGTESEKLSRYLTLAYINPTKEILKKDNFSDEILKDTSFDFEINIFEEKDLSNSSNKFNEKLEIYFVFNSSFKIKLSDELLYNSLDPKIKGEAKDLSNLEDPISSVIVCKSNDVSSFKEGLITTLKTGDFIHLTIDDIDIEKPDGSALENTDIVWPGGSVAVKIKAKPNNANFFGETDTFEIKHYFYPKDISLTELKEPLPIATPNYDAYSFKTALFSALKNGRFNGINSGDVNITKENGEPLDNNYIGTNDVVTVKLEAHSYSYRFQDSKILKIQRGSKLKTKFRIS